MVWGTLIGGRVEEVGDDFAGLDVALGELVRGRDGGSLAAADALHGGAGVDGDGEPGAAGGVGDVRLRRAAMSPYEVLGVEPDATVGVIRAAYRKIAMVAHPDRGGEAARFAEVSAAYELLVDASRRKRFDETGLTAATVDAEGAMLTEVAQLVLAAVDSGDVEREDLLGKITAALRGGIQDSRKRVEAALSAIDKRERAAKRFPRKDGAPSRIAQLIEADLESRRRSLPALEANMAAQAAHYEALLAFLAEHRYVVSSPAWQDCNFGQTQSTAGVFGALFGGGR